MLNPVKIYTTTYCGYCVAAKRLFARKGIPFEEIDATGNDDMRDWLVRASGGQRTVPQIFVGDAHVGGYIELVALDRRGELDRLLREPPGAATRRPGEADRVEEPT